MRSVKQHNKSRRVISIQTMPQRVSRMETGRVTANRLSLGKSLGLLAFLAIVPLQAEAQVKTLNGRAHDARAEGRFIENGRQLIYEGRRSGEGYFDRDGTRMVFQSEREEGNPFYQIYVLDLETGDVARVSPGHGKTTCAWLHPDGDRVLFSSTHDDPDALKEQREELDFRASGKERRYSWDYDEYFELYARDMKTGTTARLSDAKGYDAEGSYSPDGQWIAFSSNRHAYSEKLSPEQAEIFERDRSYMLDLYIMRSDGSEVRRLTHVLGYDGGPFFSPKGDRICFRRFTENGATAEVYTIGHDGKNEKKLTSLGAMSWAPYFHPSGEYLIFTTNVHGFANFELYMVDIEGRSNPVRVSYTDGFDGLPVFSPDGTSLAWTSQRTPNGSAQIFMAKWNHKEALKALAESTEDRAENAPSKQEAPDTSPEYSKDDVETWVRAMTSISHEGRASGSKASREAATLIAHRMTAIGLEPSTGSEAWYQSFELRDGTIGLNILGKLPSENQGAPPVVVGAHYDATTVGANNNASGVAALLEIAESLIDQKAKGRLKLSRDVIFAVWDGGEVGALGSRAYVKEFGSNGAACYINLDSIGSLGDQLLVYGTGSSAIWRGELERRNAPVGLPLALDDRCDLQDDSRSFFDAGIPILSMTTATDSRTTNESDTPDDLDYDSLASIARLTGLIVRAVTTSESAPTFIPWKAGEDNLAPKKPYLGTIPDYRPASIPGVVLEGVTEGGPADAAGLQKGDIIVRVSKRMIATINDYSAVLEDLKPGETVLIEVVRGEEELEFDVTVGGR